MTTILILGQNIELNNVYDATEAIIKWHVMASQARFQEEIEQRVFDLDTAKLSEVDDYQTYVNRLKSLDKQHRYWSIYDSRPIFFLAEFVKLVSEVKLLWVDLAKPSNDYERQLHKRIEAVFDKFDGQKMRLQESNPEAVNDFIIGKLVKSRGTVKKIEVKEDGDGLSD